MRQEGAQAQGASASFIEIAQQLMQPAMALAATAGIAPPAAPAAMNLPVLLQQQQQQQRSLRLVSFTADLPGMPGMLAALPAHSLTRLQLDFWASAKFSGARLAADLARLSNLQQLSLTKEQGKAGGIPTSCLDGVAQLTRLSHLSLGGQWCGGQQPLQQFLARPLPLQQLQLNLGMRLPVLDLTRCSQLRGLTINAYFGVPEGSALPQQLQRLELVSRSSRGDAVAELQLLQLQQLQHLRLDTPMKASSLQDLSQLQSLQHVALGYNHARAAQEVALSWALVPQLRELKVLTGCCSEEEHMDTILQGIGACNALTKLQLQVYAVRVEQHDSDDDSEDEGNVMRTVHMPACSMLARLTTLQDLCLHSPSSLAEGDALQLTALTNLTRPVLGGLGAGVGELAANALACSLKQLRHLDLQRCNLGSMSCLAAIAHLQQLTELRLEHNSGLTRQGLMLLTRLSNLPQLSTDEAAGESITSCAWAEFWAAVRTQRRAF
uniref:Uncharacterized protein n=1 Tax=Tetradesmus obliquus TaxID=3088 RepID=A0A383VXL9_TETOB|eukprot:jgi/Sobl393_1/2311/SZX69593.1